MPENGDEQPEIIVTKQFTRTRKLKRQQNLVSQLSPIVERFLRQADGGWSYYPCTGLEQVVAIKSIDCELRLEEVYDRVVFPAEEVEMLDEEESSPEGDAQNLV